MSQFVILSSEKVRPVLRISAIRAARFPAKNDQNGKLTFAVLHDEDKQTLRLLDEIILVWHDIGVF